MLGNSYFGHFSDQKLLNKLNVSFSLTGPRDWSCKLIRKVFAEVKTEGCFPIDCFRTGSLYLNTGIAPWWFVKGPKKLRHLVLALLSFILCFVPANKYSICPNPFFSLVCKVMTLDEKGHLLVHQHLLHQHSYVIATFFFCFSSLFIVLSLFKKT